MKPYDKIKIQGDRKEGDIVDSCNIYKIRRNYRSFSGKNISFVERVLATDVSREHEDKNNNER